MGSMSCSYLYFHMVLFSQSFGRLVWDDPTGWLSSGVVLVGCRLGVLILFGLYPKQLLLECLDVLSPSVFLPRDAWPFPTGPQK
ncbi:hypothetical protein BDV24DRAFT_140683 [Aspergillus arachidicola]|uniref:Uncharacterized protein n=1 Tax=Aspergillus arachidicola TaxID=656916 RepID=A0A5N6XZN9_9EURO|nr:hypothetical protein BDV24DRAFT_140683 [Aspergillus arachidicola]